MLLCFLYFIGFIKRNVDLSKLYHFINPCQTSFLYFGFQGKLLDIGSKNMNINLENSKIVIVITFKIYDFDLIVCGITKSNLDNSRMTIYKLDHFQIRNT